MSARGPRIAAVVVTAALLAGAAPAAALNAPIGGQRTTADAAEPDWMRALRIRSEALNRVHGLGGGRHEGEAAATRALRIRGEALNLM
jgi:hypothetical protein